MEKKLIQMQGHVLLPLKIDKPALIRQRNGAYYNTSPVVKISQIAEQYIQFETLNTCYFVSTAPMLQEVKSDHPQAICA